MKKLTDKISKILVGAGIAALPYTAHSQDVVKGNKFAVVGEDGKSYNVETVIQHGTPYVFKEVEKTEANPLGIEVYPYKFVGTKADNKGKITEVNSSVIYLPTLSEFNKVLLKQDGPLGVSGPVKKDVDYKSMNFENPMGQIINFQNENLSDKFFTFITSRGDTVYYPYVSEETDASSSCGDKLNFVWMPTNGTTISSDKDGRIGLENTKNGLYEFVLDYKRKNDEVCKARCDSVLNDSLGYQIVFIDSNLVLNNDYYDKFLKDLEGKVKTGEIDSFMRVPTEFIKEDKKKEKDTTRTAPEMYLIVGAQGNMEDFLMNEFGLRVGRVGIVGRYGSQDNQILENITTEPSPRGFYGQGTKEQLNTKVAGLSLEYHQPIGDHWDLFTGIGANKWSYDIKNTENLMKDRNVIEKNVTQYHKDETSYNASMGITGKVKKNGLSINAGFDSKAKFYGGVRFSRQLGRK